DAGEKIAAKSSELLGTAKDKSSELLETAKNSATRLGHDLRGQAASGASAVQEQVDTLLAKASGTASNLSGQARDAATTATRQAAQTFDDTLGAAKAALPDAEAR